MIRNIVAISALALLSAPALAETGVGTVQIDNVSNVYGRAGVPTVKIVGVVVTHSAGVNVAGRASSTGSFARAEIPAGDAVDQPRRS